MDFGLGLVLSFTDNASAGINSAVNSLNSLTQVAESASSSLNQMASLSALSVVSDQIGSSFLKAGTGILGVFQNVLTQTQSIGQEFENFDVTLTALFGGTSEAAEESQNALSRLFEFAKKSPLEVGDVKDMIVTLQSQGINAFDETTGAISGTRQEYLAFLTDLKSFKPEVSNERFKMAIQNYIGSGEKKMMRTVFDMGDIEDIIGHDVSDTVEGRMNDIVEMVEAKGLTGLSESMSQTWQGVASNISDAFTQIYYSIASNGVFDKLKEAFVGVANSIILIEPERLQALGKTVAEGLNIIVTPLTFVADKLANLITSVINLCETNPALVKLGMTIGAIAGVFLTLVGVVLKITSAFSGLSLMILTFGNNFASIGSLIKSGSLKMLSTLLPLTATIALLYLAWKSDFAGLRTLATNFVANVQSAFNNARQALSLNANGMIASVNNLRNTGDFWSNLTVGLIKVKTAWDILADAWSDYTISDDLYEKMEALGLEPLVNAILDLKWRFTFFKQGFIQGWQEISEKVQKFIGGLTSNLKGTIFDSLIDNVTKFVQLLTNNDPDAWEKFGEVVGRLSAKFLIAWGAVKLFTSVAGKIATVVSVVSKVGGVFSKVFGGVTKLIRPIIRGFTEVKTLLSGGMITPITKIGQVFMKLGTIASRVKTLLVNAFSFLVNLPSTVNGAFATLGTNIATAFRTAVGFITNLPSTISGLLSGIPSIVSSAFSSVVSFITNIPSMIIGGFQSAISFITSIPSMIASAVKTALSFLTSAFGIILVLVASVVTYAITHWEEFKAKVLTIWDTVKTEASAIWGSIKDGLLSIWENLKTALAPLIDKFNTMKQKFSETWEVVQGSTVFQALITILSEVGRVVVDTLVPAINGLLRTFSTAFQGIWNVVVTVFNAVVNIISAALGSIMDIISGVLDIIKGIFTLDLGLIWSGVQEIFGGIFSFISTVMTNIWNIVVSIWNAITSTITTLFGGVIDTIGGFVSGFFEAGANLIQGLLDGVCSIAESVKEWFSGFVTGVIDFVKGLFGIHSPSTVFSDIGVNIIEGLIEGVSNMLSSALEAFSGLVDGIIETFGNIIDGIGGVIDDVGSFLSGAWDGIKETASTAWDGITTTISGVWDGITTTASTFVSDVGSAISDGWDNVKETASTFASDLGTTISGAWDSITSTASTFVSDIETSLSGAWDSVKETASGAWDTLSSTVSEKWDSLKDSISTTADTITTNLSTAWDGIKETASSAWDTLKSTVSEKWDGLKDTLSSTAETITTDLSGAWDSIKESASTAWDNITTSASTAWDNVSGFIGGVWDKITGKNSSSSSDVETTASSSFSNLESETTEAWSGVQSTVESAWTSVGSTVSTVASEIETTLSTVWTGISESASTAFTGVQTTITTALTSVTTGVTTKFTAVKTTISTTLTGISTTMKTTWTGIKTTVTSTLTGISSSVTTSWSGIKSTVTSATTAVKTTVTTGFTTMKTTVTSSMSSMSSSVSSNFNTIKSTISSVMSSAVSNVSSSLSTMKNAFSNTRFSIPQTHISLPHFSVSGSLNATSNPPSVPTFSVSWYKEGGVFDKPSLIGVGEDGKEAVMPLENNTGWISELAGMLTAQMTGIRSNLIPTNNTQNIDNSGGDTTNSRYMTSNTTNNNQTTQGDVDNSVVFNEGAIQITCQSASEEEARNMAKKIMEYIKRQQQLDQMMNYA